MELNIDMPQVSDKIQGAKIPFKVSLKIEHIGVTVKVECQDAEVTALGLERKCEPISTENEKIKFSKWK
jgi:predicted secreted hydrolase